ncbi:MAG: MFS transporter [Planctomycetota bacterium]|jgi:MFS family permease
MLARFSLYGFLKNQRYFDAFLVLAFMEKGLSFFEIGLLVAVRELTVNVFEVPSGAIADVFGRRRVMILAFVAYIVSFLAFGLATHASLLFAGMFFFGIGDSFRTGTHKAMIFSWLQSNGRSDERVKIYGYTRSWSKVGSAVSVIIAAIIVLVSDSYSYIFLIAIAPYALAIVNFMGYPRDLDGTADSHRSPAAVIRHMIASVRTAFGTPRLRRLVLESSGFDGVFDAVKDYLQPVLEAAALTLAGSLLVLSDLSETRRTALLVGPVYVVLYLLAGASSRASHRVVGAFGGDAPAAAMLWKIILVLLGLLGISAYVDLHAAIIVAFVLLHVVHNLWRPLLIGRFDSAGNEAQRASLLSIENQARRAATMIIAPLIGLAVDAALRLETGGPYWPAGAIGFTIALVVYAATRSSSRR